MVGPRDALFEALVDVTASDPKVHGARIGRVRKALLQAEPPYTAADVRRFAAMLPEAIPWHKGLPSLAFVQERIGIVRAKSDQSETPQQYRERIKRELAEYGIHTRKAVSP